MVRIILFGTILFSLAISTSGQSISSRYTIGIGIGRQKVGLPFYEMFEFPPHSSYFVEINRNYSTKANSDWYQTIGLNFYGNNSAGPGYYLQSHVGRNLLIGKSIVLSPEGGIALSHRFHPKQIYELSDGQYQPTKDFGKIRPSLNLKVILGYQTQLALLYVSYQANAEFFYNDDSLVLPSNFLQFGIRYQLKSTEK